MTKEFKGDPDNDADLDEDGETDVEHFPIPAGLLEAAEVDDDEWDDL